MIQMRDKNLNFIQFWQSAEQQLTKQANHFSKDRRTSVIDSPTFLQDYDLVIPRKFNELRSLCVIVHYINEDSLKWKLRLDLEKAITRFDSKKVLELELLLKSKESMLVFLFETNRYTSHEIFGNIIGMCAKNLQLVKFKRISTKVRRSQRKRGYDDKGSLRPTEKWLERFDWSFTEAQNEKEKKLKLHLKALQFLEQKLQELFSNLTE